MHESEIMFRNFEPINQNTAPEIKVSHQNQDYYDMSNINLFYKRSTPNNSTSNMAKPVVKTISPPVSSPIVTQIKADEYQPVAKTTSPVVSKVEFKEPEVVKTPPIKNIVIMPRTEEVSFCSLCHKQA